MFRGDGYVLMMWIWRDAGRNWSAGSNVQPMFTRRLR